MLSSGSIFVSYRLNDRKDVVEHIADRLKLHFGDQTVFIDYASLHGGDDYPRYLIEAVESCKVLVAVIGDSWLKEIQVLEKSHKKDWVRMELECALENPDIQLIPILVGNAQMPDKKELPTSLQPLLRFQATKVRSREDFGSDIQKLIRLLTKKLGLPISKNSRSWPNHTSTDPLEDLAQQMRDWFITLGYSFENYEELGSNYFEWIINIPVRRKIYTRVLVRGVVEKVRLAEDVKSLNQSVQAQQTDEGWLVTSQRVESSAREEVDKPENRHLGCYTLDELIHEDADFEVYLKELELEVEKRGINENYIDLACTKEEFDQDTGKLIATNRYREREGWIDGYIDDWLTDSETKHISILGEFGTGKTWFALHYAWEALKRYKDARNKRIERPRLPIVIPLRDYAKAVSVESLFSEFFFRKYEIPIPNYTAFLQLNRMGKLLLIFDGFDEMAARVDRQEMINNFWELAKVVVPGSKVILTCRTEHFPEAKEVRAIFESEQPLLPASTQDLPSEKPSFEILKLEKFDEKQVYRVLLSKATELTRQELGTEKKPEDIVEKIINNPQLLDLARRPIMTELILEALPDIDADIGMGKSPDMSRVYLYAVRKKMDRDIDAKRTFTSLADKLYFMCELSWEMLSTDRLSLNYREFPDRIRQLFGADVREKKDLDHWNYDMLGQTMLIRNSNGDYTPAHRSLIEFFMAYKFAAELGVLPADFIYISREQSNSHIDSSRRQKDYKWSDYFLRQLDEEENIIKIAPLANFIPEELDTLLHNFSSKPFTKPVYDLMTLMLNASNDSKNSEEKRERNNTRQRLTKTLASVRGKQEKDINYFGGNIATLLAKWDPFCLESQNLSNCIIRGADFSQASLRETNFTGSDLSGALFPQVSAPVICVAFNNNGSCFATAEGDEIRLWSAFETDSSEWNQFNVLKEHGAWVRTITFSPVANNILASGSYDREVRVWDIASGRCIETLTGHSGTVRSVCFSPDGKLLASSGDDGKIILWDTTTWKLKSILPGHERPVRAVVFLPDNNFLASGSQDRTIKIWNFRDGICEKVLDNAHDRTVRSLAVSPNLNILASASKGKFIRIWDTNTWECIRALNSSNDIPIWSIALSQDGKILASGDEDGIVKIWNLDYEDEGIELERHDNWVRSVAISPDNKTLISGSEDKSVKLCDLNERSCKVTLQGHTSWIWSIAFSQNGKMIAGATEDELVRIWNTETGQCLVTLPGHQGAVRAIAFHPLSPSIVASGGDGKRIRIWDIELGEIVEVLSGHTNWIRALAFSPDGSWLATGGNDSVIRLWNTDTWQVEKEFYEHEDTVIRGLEFSPCSQILASVGEDRELVLRYIFRQPNEIKPEIHTKRVPCISFSQDGNLLATGCEDGSIKIWDIENWPETSICQQHHIKEAHNSYVNSVQFMNSGRILASASSDKSVKLWNVKTGELIRTLKGHTSSVCGVSVDVEERVLASCSEDETVILWDLDLSLQDPSIPKRVLSNKRYAGMNITNVRGIGKSEKDNLKKLGAIEEI